MRGPALDRDAGGPGRKASGGLSAVRRLPDTQVLRVAARRGRAAGREAGLAPLTWGRGGGLGGRRLQLCPPDIAAAPAARCRDVAAAGLSVPAARVRGACGQGYFLPHLKASVGSRVILWLFPFLRPAHFAPFLLAMLVVLLSGVDCFLGRSLPARNALLQS